MRDVHCPMILGNADAGLLDPSPADSDSDGDKSRIIEIDNWCAGQLDDADRAFIESFQPTVDVSLGEAGILLCCHGSPRDYNDIIRAITPDAELDTLLAGTEATMQAVGHTHVRMLRNWRGREIINPGSVGLAYQFFPDGSVRVPPWAELAVVAWSDAGALSVDFRRVTYDRAATVRAMFERDMPHAAW